MEDCIHSKHCNDDYDDDDADDDGGSQQRELQTSHSPHENSVWHTIHNSVTKKTQKHTEFNKKKKLKRENSILSKLTLAGSMAVHNPATHCHNMHLGRVYKYFNVSSQDNNVFTFHLLHTLTTRRDSSSHS